MATWNLQEAGTSIVHIVDRNHVITNRGTFREQQNLSLAKATLNTSGSKAVQLGQM